MNHSQQIALPFLAADFCPAADDGPGGFHVRCECPTDHSGRHFARDANDPPRWCAFWEDPPETYATRHQWPHPTENP